MSTSFYLWTHRDSAPVYYTGSVIMKQDRDSMRMTIEGNFLSNA